MADKNKKDIRFEQPSDILLLVNRFLIVIIASIILAILAMGYFLILKPKIDSISDVKILTTDTEERRKDNEDFLERIKELEAEYYDIVNNRKEDLEFLKKMVPDELETERLFLIADIVAKEHNFTLNNVKASENIERDTRPETETEEESSDEPEEPTIDTAKDFLASAGMKTATLKFSIFRRVEEGDPVLGEEIYNDFKNYLSELENNIRLLDIHAINFDSIDAEPGADGASTYTFNLDLITYYQ